MQNYNHTIPSLVRIAKQLDEAGLYEQSDLVHESLLRIAQQIKKTNVIPDTLYDRWNYGTGLRLPRDMRDFFRTFIFPNTEDEIYFSEIRNRTNIIQQIINEYTKTGTISQDFVDLFTRSPQLRKDIFIWLGSRDLLEEADNVRFQIISKMGAAREKKNWREYRKLWDLLHEAENRHDYLQREWNISNRNSRDNQVRLRMLLSEVSDIIYDRIKNQSNDFTRMDKVGPLVADLKRLQDMGIKFNDSISEIIGKISSTNTSTIIQDRTFYNGNDPDEYLKTRLKAVREFKGVGELSDEEIEELIKEKRNTIQLLRSQRELTADEELKMLEESLGLSQENPNASQYPKAPETSSVPQQQTIGGQKGDTGKDQRSLYRSINKPTKPSQPNVQRVRFKSPGAGSSATTLEEFFRLVQLKPDRWEQFNNNNNKDPKLNLDEIKKLFKAIGAKMGKGSVGLSNIIKGINFNDPRWQLIEPAIEIAFNEFGKYLENPSSYSSNLKPNIDEIKKFFSPILAWQELIKKELQTKSPKDLLKYFTNNNPSVSIQGPTSPALTKGINAGPLFEIGYINYRFNDLSNKEKEDIIYMIKNGGNLPRSQSEIENEQREQIRKMQEKYPVSGQGDLRLQQQLQRNMMR